MAARKARAWGAGAPCRPHASEHGREVARAEAGRRPVVAERPPGAAISKRKPIGAGPGSPSRAFCGRRPPSAATCSKARKAAPSHHALPPSSRSMAALRRKPRSVDVAPPVLGPGEAYPAAAPRGPGRRPPRRSARHDPDGRPGGARSRPAAPAGGDRAPTAAGRREAALGPPPGATGVGGQGPMQHLEQGFRLVDMCRTPAAPRPASPLLALPRVGRVDPLRAVALLGDPVEGLEGLAAGPRAARQPRAVHGDGP